MSRPGSPRALIVVDVQNDFCEGGSLAVEGGTAVADRIATYVDRHAGDYAAIVATMDWHEDPGAHFADHPDYVDSWPAHCLAGTPGASLRVELDPILGSVDALFRKGRHAAAYSGFEGTTSEHGTQIGLRDWLADGGIRQVDIVGIATDHCVRATALDAVAAGFPTRVLLDLTAGVAPETTTKALAALREAGVELSGTPYAP